MPDLPARPDGVEVDLGVEFFVAGLPAPGGSKRGFPIKGRDGRVHVAMTEAGGERTKNWRASVALAAQGAFVIGPLEGPVMLELWFYMPRPKAHRRKDGGLVSWAPIYPAKKPDLTKLVRSTEDALTGIAWLDDAQVVEQHVRKAYVGSPYMTAGCRIRVTP